MDFSVSCTPLIVKLVCCLICATVKIIFQVITVSFDDVSFKLCVIQVDGENHKSVVIRGSSWGSEMLGEQTPWQIMDESRSSKDIASKVLLILFWIV